MRSTFFSRLTVALVLFLGVTALVCLPLAAAAPAHSSALDSDFKSPSMAINTAFDSPTNAFANDADAATRSNTNISQSYGGYAFSIPADATVEGIQVRADAWRSADPCAPTVNVTLSWDSGSLFTSPFNSGNLTTADPEGALLLGGATNLWGHAWTADEINSTLVVRVQTLALASGCTVYLDWLAVRVYYSVPTATETPTESATIPYTPSNTPTITQSPTSTPTLTNTPTAPSTYSPLALVINEVAWTGTDANSADEWLELYNPDGAAIDLTGWTLTDDDDIHIALSGNIPAGGYFLLERTDDHTVDDIAADQLYTGSLNNNGETLTLRDPASNIIDTANGDGGAWSAGNNSSHCSMERVSALNADTDANWATNNNVTRNGHDANGNAICGTPRQANSTLFPIVQTATPTRTPTATPPPAGLFVNEFMPDPESDWNKDSVTNDDDEWIEIYNANSFDVDLSNWILDDVLSGGSMPYPIPNGTVIQAHGFLLFFRQETHIALNNTDDDVRLLQPDGSVADAISYKTSEPDKSWSRVPDGAPSFSMQCPPTPHAANCSIPIPPTLTPTPFPNQIFINEFLSAPYQDWNHDGMLDSGDEWIELYNAAPQTADLSGWQLDDENGGSSPYTIPDGTLIDAKGFLIFFDSETHIGLNNDGDTVRLLYPDGSVADKKKYNPLKTNQSEARSPDGAEHWVIQCNPTPRKPNCSKQPPPVPTRALAPMSIAEARELPLGSKVSVLGSVIAHPCELDAFGHEMTLSDGVAGISVYREFPDSLSCLIPRNEQMVITGVLGEHNGLLTIYPSTDQDVTRHYAAAYEITPRSIHTGNFNERIESMLVMIQGKVSNGSGGEILWVNDGTGIVEVRAEPGSGVSFQGITRGSIVRIVGIGYQSNRYKREYEGYFLRPRATDDVTILKRADKLPPAPGGRGVDIGAVSVQDALTTRTRNYVTVGGVVIVPPGVIGKRDFWIQDANGGVHVYVAASAGAPPKLKLYENVTVRGRVVNRFGAREIRIELPSAIGQYGKGSPVKALARQTGQVSLRDEGILVSIQGWVTRVKGRELYIEDGSGEVLVYIDANTRIRLPKVQTGDPVQITGVVTRFRGKPEILPRYPSDVQLGVMLLPVAGALDSYFAGVVKALERIGKPPPTPRAPAANQPSDVKGIPQSPTISRRDGSLIPLDPLAIASYVLLAASGIVGVLAVHKYRTRVL